MGLSTIKYFYADLLSSLSQLKDTFSLPHSDFFCYLQARNLIRQCLAQSGILPNRHAFYECVLLLPQITSYNSWSLSLRRMSLLNTSKMHGAWKFASKYPLSSGKRVELNQRLLCYCKTLFKGQAK